MITACDTAPTHTVQMNGMAMAMCDCHDAAEPSRAHHDAVVVTVREVGEGPASVGQALRVDVFLYDLFQDRQCGSHLLDSAPAARATRTANKPSRFGARGAVSTAERSCDAPGRWLATAKVGERPRGGLHHRNVMRATDVEQHTLQRAINFQHRVSQVRAAGAHIHTTWHGLWHPRTYF